MIEFTKIYYLLKFSGRKKTFFLFFLIFFTALIDVVGIASILPFIGVLLNPELIKTNNYIFYFYQFIDKFYSLNTDKFILFFGLLTFFLYFLSIFFRTITTYFRANFALMSEHTIGMILIERYLRQPYSWFLKRDCANFIKIILSEVHQVVDKTILASLNLISYLILSVLILVLLFFLNPIVASITILILFSGYIIIFLIIKNILHILGNKSIKSNEFRFFILNQIFSAIKEIKILGKEKNFSEKFFASSEVYSKCESFISTISQVPRFFIEGVAFGGLILFIIFMYGKTNFIEIIPFLAVYVFAGYRLLPSLQQIYFSITQIYFSKPAFDSLYKEFSGLQNIVTKKSTVSKMQFNKSIVLKNIYFKHQNNKKLTLNNINLHIPALSKTAIVGATGSGKTTLVDIMLCLLDADQGTFSVDGKIINSSNKQTWQKKIGYVPQKIYLANASIADNIAFGSDTKNIDHELLERVAKIVDFHDFIVTELKDGYKTLVGENGVKFSGGQIQKIGIARALYLRPKLIVLDEATNALDGFNENLIINNICASKNKTTLIFITHRLTSINKFDLIFFMKNGSIVGRGNFNQLLINNKDFYKFNSALS